MVTQINVKKGLSINLKGAAQKRTLEVDRSLSFSVYPDDFQGFEPKLLVKAGDAVLAGSPIMYDKQRPSVKIASPVSGVVAEVNRGERRKILSIVINPDAAIEYQSFSNDLSRLSGDQVKQAILDAGLWWTIKQRPYDVIADPEVAPRDIFVTGFDSAPLAPCTSFVLEAENKSLEAGLKALTMMTSGKVYLGVSNQVSSTVYPNVSGVEKVTVKGAHPAGNVGVQINQIAPVNKGETVWALSIFDLVFIGRLFTENRVNLMRRIALTGSEIVKTGYVDVIVGASVASFLGKNLVKSEYNQRIISGNVLTGTKISIQDALGFNAKQITVIPEGDDHHELFGWGTPGFGKFSVSRSFFSWLTPKKDFVIDARIRGGERAIIMSGEYDRVFPMDIMAEQLIKATLAFDIEKMENLGIYEVSPEDFALCEFVDTSKIELQYIIRTGLDRLRKEMM